MVTTRIVLAAVLLAAGCAAAPPQAPTAVALNVLEGTAWQAEEIERTGVLDRAPSTIVFDAGQKIAGRAGCNRYFGSFEQSGDAVTIKPTGSTRMACAPDVMDQEGKFLSALEAVTTARREGDKLLLLDGGGRLRMRLIAVPRSSARLGLTSGGASVTIGASNS
jgi:heat shock protein HslJ